MFGFDFKGKTYTFNETHVNMVSVFVIVVCACFLFFKMSIPSALPIAFFITCLMFTTGGQPSFVVALAMLIVTMFMVAFKKDLLAENAAIVVYYMLLSGVVLEIVNDWPQRIYRKYKKYLHA